MRSLFGKKHKDTATSSSSAGLHKKPTGGKVFGTPLIDVCEREKTEIPQVATEVMEYLDKNGLKVEGIFRIPGNSIQIQQLQDYYDCIEPKKASDVLTIDTIDDVHAVACVLKQYLRDLPDPLLTHRFYDTFITIMKNPDYDYRISNIKKLITALPPAHKSLLQHLFSFLLRVAAQSDVNKMTFPNLAIVFGPNLLRPRHESMLRMIEDARHVNSLIKLLLEEYEFLIMGTTDKPKNAALYKKPDPTPAPASAPVVVAAGSAPSTPKGVTTNPAIAGGRAHTDRRRAFKFDPADLSTQTFTEDESVDPGEKEARTEPPAKPRRAGAAAVTASVGLPPSKRMSAMGVILMTPEMEQEVKDFDLTRPLQHAMNLLNIDRQKCARGADCSTMNPLQLKAEKAAVKRILRNFDVSFKEKHGHLPNKADKEPLRPLYQQYRELTQIIDNTIPPPVPARGTAPKPAVVDEQVKLLRKEKRQLQLFLHKYQEEFIARNGRKVQYLEDRLPVQREYDRYKELKLQLADGD